MDVFLRQLQGPQGESGDIYKLEKQHFRDNHFSTSAREKSVQEKINKFLHINDLVMSSEIQNTLNALTEALKKHSVEIISVQDLPQQESLPLHLEATLELCDKLLEVANKFSNEESIQDIVTDLKQGRDELSKLKTVLYNEGLEIADTVHSEIHRKLTEQTIGLLTSALTLVAGILFICFPNHKMIGFMLALTASVVTSLKIVGGKSVSQERFLQLERKLHLLQKRKVAAVDPNDMPF